MKTTEEKTKVIFRIDKAITNREVTAVFPEHVRCYSEIACYAHVGHHSICSYDWYLKKTKPATPEQYADLKQELEKIGYVLNVRKRM